MCSNPTSRGLSFIARAILSALSASAPLASSASSPAQSDTTGRARTVTMVAGAHYASPPGGQKWLLGNDYRDLWATPLEVEVLDMNTFAGGLTPVMRVGGMQTLGLALKGQDGRDYSFRSLDKDYSDEVIAPAFRGTFMEEIIQDQIAANCPAVQVVAYPIEQAAGVLGLPDPRLVVMPDDPALGEFQALFAGVLGVIVEFPQPVSDTNPGFHGAVEILSPDDFWAERQAGTRYMPDTRAFLRARLLDIFLNDWDRHRNQWRWVRFPDEPLLQPIPEDRDQVFTDYEGVLLGMARFQGARLVKYGDEIEPLRRITKNGWDVDRFLLTDIERSEWMEIANDLQSRLTDAVLDEGVRRLPPEYYQLRGEELATKLKSRRDGITDLAERYYAYLSDRVDVQCTNSDDRVTVRRLESGDMEVEVSTVLADGSQSPPYYRRRFVVSETEEVRVYLHGGQDVLHTEGEEKPGITVRVIGGPGTNTVDDSNGFGVIFYASEGENRVVGDSGTKFRTKPLSVKTTRSATQRVSLNTTPWVPPKDWGGTTRPVIIGGYQSDPGLVLGAGFDRKNYGFRKYPWANRHTLKGGFAFGVLRPFVDYKGRFRRESSWFGYKLEFRFSGFDQLRYFGLGNETPAGSDDASKITQYRLYLFPAVALSGSEKADLALGPIVKYTDSAGTDSSAVLGQEQPLGSEQFGQVGLLLRGKYDSRGSGSVLDPGISVEGDAAYFFEIWDASESFGYVDAHVAGWIPLAKPLLLSLHVRGRSVWGNFPYFEAAYIGGATYPIGTKWDRWAGEASLGGLTSLRWTIAGFRGFVPGNFGLFGMTNTARVFVDDEDSSKWHPSYAGGVFVTSFDRTSAFHLGAGSSEEDGFFFMFIANLAGLGFQ